MATAAEEAAMRRAIAISAAALGRSSPNPPVGCVILSQSGRFVAEGFHERKGEMHAEAQALAAAGDDAQGGTAVVTLEPCNHHGLTPPCHQALLDARVSRVVVALLDPTSRGQGGVAALRSAGISVEAGVLDDEARIVLGPWLAPLAAARPWITWPYLVADSLITALPRDLLLTGGFLASADAVWHEDWTACEAVPGSHGEDMLSIPDPIPSDGAQQAASKLFHGGVRRLILSAGHAGAAPFLASGLVDSVAAYLPKGPPSRRSGIPQLWPLLPPGFRITGLARTDGFVIATGHAT